MIAYPESWPGLTWPSTHRRSGHSSCKRPDRSWADGPASAVPEGRWIYGSAGWPAAGNAAPSVFICATSVFICVPAFCNRLWPPSARHRIRIEFLRKPPDHWVRNDEGTVGHSLPRCSPPRRIRVHLRRIGVHLRFPCNPSSSTRTVTGCTTPASPAIHDLVTRISFPADFAPLRSAFGITKTWMAARGVIQFRSSLGRDRAGHGVPRHPRFPEHRCTHARAG